MIKTTLYLTLSIIGFTLLGLNSKISEKKVRTSRGLVFVLCMIAAIFLTATVIINPLFVQISKKLLCLGTVAGVTASTAFICLTFAIRNGNFGFSITFANASFLIPVLFSAITYNKPLGTYGILGILLVLFSLTVISFNNNNSSQKNLKISPKWLAAVWGSFVLNGICQVCQDTSARLPSGETDTRLFLFIMYASGALLLLPFVLKNKELDRPALAFGSIGAVASLTGTFFMIQSLSWLPTSVVFPACLCVPILLSSIISAIFFKEPIKVRDVIGLSGGIAGLILLSIA